MANVIRNRIQYERLQGFDMQKNEAACVNCLNNPSNKNLNVKMVKITLEIDEDLAISDCDLCILIREFLGSKVRVASLLSHG